jgi:hypothetical protein
MKKLKLLLLFAGVMLLAGCGNKAVNNPETGTVSEPSPAKTESKDAGVISSIKDAMGLGQEMKCTYKMKVGNDTIETISYVNGKKYMTETLVAGNKQKMVFDEQAIYSWPENAKTGTKFYVACMKELEKNIPKTNDNSAAAPDPTGEKTFDNALDVSCVPASGADFSIPSDVVFTDQCEMMKNVLKNIPANIPGNIPSGMPTP